MAEVLQIVTGIDRAAPKRVRDAAVIPLGIASALRRSKLTALTIADIEAKPGGVLIMVRRSKTGPEGDGQIVAVAHERHALTEPFAALAEWTAVRGSTPGPLYTSLRNGILTDEPISGEAVARMPRSRARAAGLSAVRITGHSLRAVHATTAALAGVALDRIVLQTRHRRLSTLIERYIRPAQAPEATSSCDLGL